MKYILLNKGAVILVTEESPWTGTPTMKEFPGLPYDQAKSARDLASFEEATDFAAQSTTLTGELFLPYDEGSSTWPRFGIFTPPTVGDDVSYGFNGDYYYDSKIARITKNWMIITENGTRYNRVRKTSGFKKVGGTWWMVKGIHNEQNPHF